MRTNQVHFSVLAAFTIALMYAIKPITIKPIKKIIMIGPIMNSIIYLAAPAMCCLTVKSGGARASTDFEKCAEIQFSKAPPKRLGPGG